MLQTTFHRVIAYNDAGPSEPGEASEPVVIDVPGVQVEKKSISFSDASDLHQLTILIHSTDRSLLCPDAERHNCFGA